MFSDEAERDVHLMKRSRITNRNVGKCRQRLRDLHENPPVNYDFGKHWGDTIVDLLDKSKFQEMLCERYGTIPVSHCCPVAHSQPEIWGQFLTDLLEWILVDESRFRILLLTETEEAANWLTGLRTDSDRDSNSLSLLWKYMRHKLLYDWPREKSRLGFYALRNDAKWTVAFGRIIIPFLFPHEKWQIRKGAHWSTWYSSSRHMVFDICKWADDERLRDHSRGFQNYTSSDKSMGGLSAWTESDPEHKSFTWNRLCLDLQHDILSWLSLWSQQQMAHTSKSCWFNGADFITKATSVQIDCFDPRTFSFLRSLRSCKKISMRRRVPISPAATRALAILLEQVAPTLIQLDTPRLCATQLCSLHGASELKQIRIDDCGRPLIDIFPTSLTVLAVSDPYYFVTDLRSFIHLQRLAISVVSNKSWRILRECIEMMVELKVAELSVECSTGSPEAQIEEEEVWTHPGIITLSISSLFHDGMFRFKMAALKHLELRNSSLLPFAVLECPALTYYLSFHRLYRVQNIQGDLQFVKTKWTTINRKFGSLVWENERHVSCLHICDERSASLPITGREDCIVFHGPEIPFLQDLEEMDSEDDEM